MREIIFGAIVVAVTLVSFAVVLHGANEPYTSIRAFDIIVQLGLGPLAIIAWLGIVQHAVVRAIRSEIFMVWIAIVMWAVVCLTYLGVSVVGYIHDINKYAL